MMTECKVEAKVRVDRWGQCQLLTAAVLLYLGSKLSERVIERSVRIHAK